MSEEPRLEITTGKMDYWEQAAEFHAKHFFEDPCFHWAVASSKEERRLESIPLLIYHLIKLSALNGAIFDEIGDWKSSVLWLPPGRTNDNPIKYFPAGMHKPVLKTGLRGLKRMTYDFQYTMDKLKKKTLQEKGWKKLIYVFFVSTRPDSRRQGLAAKLLEPLQAKAQEMNVPIWLEASTAGSKKVYERIGFQVVETITLGKGIVDSRGYPCPGGPGAYNWPMIWEPKKFSMRHPKN